MAYAVTPTLFVGEWVDMDHIPVRDPLTAARFIERGHTVVVPTFMLADRVLEHLGVSTRARHDKLHFAMTGQVL